MNKPSERIVVFVTTAQKRAITATAENLGISVSELMRRAVLSFGATSEQVKAASIVDRLRAPRAPDALNAALQRVARGTRYARPLPPAESLARDSGQHANAQSAESAESAAAHAAAHAAEPADAHAAVSSAAENAAAAPKNPLPRTLASADAASLLPAGVMAALSAAADEEATAAAEAVARVAAAKAATAEQSALEQAETEAQLRRVLKRPRVDTSRDEDDSQNDPSTEGGRFA